MTIQDLKEQIINFYDIETEEKKMDLINSIIDISNKSDRVEFVKEIRETFPQRQLSGIGVIYEALGHHPEEWGEFFYEEIQRAFEAAENSNEAYKILDSLEALCMMDRSRMKQKSQIVSFLSQYLNHPIEVLRYKSIWYLVDWIEKDSDEANSYIIEKVKTLLRSDTWRIQLVAKEFLERLGYMPSDYKMSLSDRLKAKFLRRFSM